MAHRVISQEWGRGGITAMHEPFVRTSDLWQPLPAD